LPSITFLLFVQECSLNEDTRRYYRIGWRLLKTALLQSAGEQLQSILTGFDEALWNW